MMISRDSKQIKKRGLILFLTFCLLSFSLLPLSLAWFANLTGEPVFSANAILGYFDPASGTGESEAEAYLISEPIHFYNFAWLQNVGAFDGKTVYLKIKDGVEVLNMAGALDGTTGKTGAIPPIGSEARPFVGHFDGNGAVIQNLWVSTDKDDWFEKPAEHELYTVGTDIGLFGYVGYGANISNFYLENIEVTNTITEETNLGIIVGFVDGDISNIGVKNAKLSFKDGKNTQVTSEYTLVGHKTENVRWEELPSNNTGEGGTGGELLINPTVTPNDPVISSGIKEVDGAKKGTAYYVGELNVQAPKPNPGKGVFYKMNSSVTFSGQISQCISQNTTASDMNLDDEENIAEENLVYLEIFSGSGNRQAIFPGDPIDFSGVENATSYPLNCVWFKPIAPGECAIAFCRQTNSGDETMSIFRFQRDPNTGLVIESTKQEIVFILAKSGGFGNPSVTCFTLPITEEDVNNQYEYVIGSTSTASKNKLSPPSGKWGSSAGFLFLKLAGTNANEGPGEYAPDDKPWRMLSDIDFVETTDVDLKTVDMHRSIVTLSGTQSSEGALYFDAADGKVLYCNESSLTLTQQITVNPQGMLVTKQEHTFPPRAEVNPIDTGQ